MQTCTHYVFLSTFPLSAPLPLPPPTPVQCVALYDYDPQTSSPNDEPSDELSLTTGDTVKVLENVRDDGFVKAEVRQSATSTNKFHGTYSLHAYLFMNALLA